MAEVVQKFLNARLFEVGDNDERVVWMEAAAADLTDELKKRPTDIPKYTLVALDPQVSPDDPALDRVETLLSKRWKNLIGHFGGRPVVLLRAVIGESLSSLTRTRRFGGCIALTAYGASTHIDAGNEAEAWGDVLRKAQDKLGAGTNIYWGVLSRPSSEDAEVADPKVAPLKRTSLSKSILSGLRTGAMEGLQPNPHEYGTDPWADHAAKRIAEGVGMAVDDALTGTLQSAQLRAVPDAIQELRTTMRAASVRSEILWWLQAGFSELLDSGYAELPSEVAVVAMASDFFSLSLPYPPRSAQAFLNQAIRGQVGEGATTLKKLTEAVRDHDRVDVIDSALGRSREWTGRVTLLEYLRREVRRTGGQGIRAVVSPSQKVPLAQVGTWLFSDFAGEQLATKKEP